MNELPEDFRDLLLELADVGAEFVLVGGHAVAFHGHPRATKDMDVPIRANTSNAELVYRALADFGAPLSNSQVTAEDFATYSAFATCKSAIRAFAACGESNRRIIASIRS